MPIFCRITNLNGSKEVGLEIKEEQIQNLQSSTHVKNPVFTVHLIAGEGEFQIEDWKKHLKIPIIGTNSIQGVEGITSEQITLKEGTSLDFLNSTVRSCIVSQRLMKEHKWEVGDSVSLNLYYYYHKDEYSMKIDPLDLVDFKIVGTMEETTFIDNGYLPPEILLPFGAVQEIYHAKEIPFSADSVSFYLADPLKLNEFKAEMKKNNLLQIVPEAKDSYKGVALYVKDSLFIKAANRLRQVMDTLMRFLPIILIIVIFIGYIISYMMVYSRKKDFSIMRSIGFRYKEVFAVFFIEQFLLALCGSIVHSIISAIFITHNLSILLVVNLWFLVNFMLGNVISIWIFGKRNVLEALSQND
jgi:ABC-type antimicrobial peptide transport system permease subunit